MQNAKKFFMFFIKKPYKKIQLLLNKLGKKRQCYVCKNTFNNFLPYKNGSKSLHEFVIKLNIVGSDVENFSCIHCGSSDRERHLFMFFDKLSLWDKLHGSKILHFAPETHLIKKIETCNPKEYILGNIVADEKKIKKIDVTKILFNNEYFDIVICNHVLEHITNHYKAIEEIYRVLKFNGLAILQTPYSKLLIHNFQDPGINNDELREFYYGEKDHYRIFSEKSFLDDLKKAGFSLNIGKNKDMFTESESAYYGVNHLEDLIMVKKIK